MKYGRGCFLLLLLPAGVVLSCASRPSAAGEVERALPSEGAAGTLSLAVQKIKMNSPAVLRYFQLDGDDGITVRGTFADDAGEYEVAYDLKNALREGDGGYVVPFSVREAGSGAEREDCLFWTAGDDETGLLLSCDDDYRASWEAHYDLMDRYGAKVTFFVQGSVSHEGGGELAAFCKEAIRRGHDVGFHTVHHLNLTKVSWNAFYRETIAAAGEFAGAGIPLAAFAYPYGLSEPWMHESLLPFFGVLRGYGVKFRLYNTGEIRPGYIVSKAIDNIIYKRDDDFEREIALMLLAAKFIGRSVVPFTTHDISDAADWGIKPRRLEYLLKTARDLKLRFYRYRDFY
jgi:peptidoglycan/xylan/chitin deacetylase (PgdA/CDA1 family)